MVLATLHGNGWTKVKDGILEHRGEWLIVKKNEKSAVIVEGWRMLVWL